MRHFKLLVSVVVVSFICITGCKKDTSTESSAMQRDVQLQSNTLSKQSTLSSAQLKEKLTKLRASLPAGSEARLKLRLPSLLKVHPEYRSLVARVLGVEPTPCDDNTPLNMWLGQQLADWNDEVIFFALITGMLDFPTYDALLFENSPANQYFGINGEYTQRVVKTTKDLKRFWNIESKDIIVVAMHGSMLQDRDRVIRIDQILYGDDQATAEFWADLILQLLKDVPQYRNGDHPIFTFNAFAQPTFSFPPYGIIPNKIVMGDGIMQAYSALGYGDVAPQAILAHEYGHHVQFQLGVFGGATGPEATRRTELMADAFSAYYLSHARGAAMQWKRVKQFLQVFFNIGDCAFNNNGHHGTPTQRMAAAEWGYQLADNAQKQGHILSAQKFVALFDAKLPYIVQQ